MYVSAAFCISMPLRIDTLAIIHRNTKLLELYTVLVEAACRSLRLLESVLIEQIGLYTYFYYNFLSILVHLKKNPQYQHAAALCTYKAILSLTLVCLCFEILRNIKTEENICRNCRFDV